MKKNKFKKKERREKRRESRGERARRMNKGRWSVNGVMADFLVSRT